MTVNVSSLKCGVWTRSRVVAVPDAVCCLGRGHRTVERTSPNPRMSEYSCPRGYRSFYTPCLSECPNVPVRQTIRYTHGCELTYYSICTKVGAHSAYENSTHAYEKGQAS